MITFYRASDLLSVVLAMTFLCICLPRCDIISTEEDL